MVISMDNSAKLIWADVLEVALRKYQDQKMLAWLDKLAPYTIDDSNFICVAPLQWPTDVVMRDYKQQIEECLHEITMEQFEFTAQFNPELYEQITSDQNKEAPAQTIAKPQIKPVVESVQEPVYIPQPAVTVMPSHQEYEALVVQRPHRPVTRDSRTFDTFIAGDSNTAAMVSAQKVAEMPGRMFNPFFLYSKSGLGKTHLLMAIKNYINEFYPDKTTLYVTSEQFLQDYIRELAESKKKQTGQPIMPQYRNIDVLLVDDIQFLESKNESQEYFFATFEDLIRKGKQIVLSADRSPKELKMDERMTSRFQSGLSQNIQPPSFELKLAILKSFYQRTSVSESWYQAEISEELLRYIAEVSSSNIREIQGFLTSIMVIATSKNKNGYQLTKEDITEAANDAFDIQRKTIEISTIQREVEKRYGISHDDMIGSKRTKNINFPRQIAMYLSRELTDEVFASIGKKFGGRDHTTIMNGVGNIEKKMKEDRTFYDNIEQLKIIIRERS